jgi:hypothetical protein
MTNRYAIIENGVVANVVVADAEFAAMHGLIVQKLAPDGLTLTVCLLHLL